MSKLLATLPQTPLDRDTEIALTKRPDKNELVMSVMREACLYMTKCCRSKLPEDEIFSLAYSALMKASENFRAGCGTRFLGYAKVYLRGEISRAWKSKDVVRSASMHETGENTYYTPEYIDRQKKGEEELYCGVEHAESESVLKETAEPEFELIDLHEKWALVEPLLERYLNEHERTILALHYRAGLTFVEIAKMVCPRVSRSAIEAVHSKALRKIRNILMRVGRLYN